LPGEPLTRHETGEKGFRRDDKTVSAPVGAETAGPSRWQALQLRSFTIFLVALGLVLIVIGGHDAALSHSTVGVTAASALLLFAGAFLLAASWLLDSLRRHEPWKDGSRPPCHPVVLAAFLITGLLGLYLVFSAFGTATGTQRVLVVSVALVIVAVAALGLLFFASDVSLTAPRVGAVALGLVGTTLGAWEFWYQNQYVPSRAGGTVQLKAELLRIKQQGPFDVIRARINYEAIGGKSVSAVGSAYTLTGSSIIACPREATVSRVRDYFQGFLLDPQRVRFMADVVEGGPTVLAAGKFVADGKRLDPDVPANREFIFFVPRHRYQLLRFRAQVFAVPASVRLSQRTPPEYFPLAGDNELYGYWRMDDDSWLHDLVFGRERWLVLRYELVDPGDLANRAKSAKAVPTSQVLHVLARFPNASWGKGRPSPKATKQLFDHPGAINSQEPGDASEPFAASELPLERVDANCESRPVTTKRALKIRRSAAKRIHRNP
jgi:hypothetical protein